MINMINTKEIVQNTIEKLKSLVIKEERLTKHESTKTSEKIFLGLGILCLVLSITIWKSFPVPAPEVYISIEDLKGD